MHRHSLFVLVLLTFLFLSCPTDEPGFSGITLDLTTAVQPANSLIIPPDFAGMCHAGYSDSLDREYEILNEMGVVWIHRDFSWNKIEPSQGNWNYSDYDSYVALANAEGKKIMGMLLYQAEWIHTDNGHPDARKVCPDEISYFTNYARETVKRYNGENGRGKVDAWLIWNEPDADNFWKGTKEEFFALNKATVEAIRELDAELGTHTTLVGGVFTALVSNDWINGLLADGVAAGLDGIAYHPYSANPLGSLAWLNSFKQKVAPFGFADKIWLNEVGFPTYPDKSSPSGSIEARYEGDMPEVVAQTFTLLAAGGARSLTWYHLSDSGSSGFGLIWGKSGAEWVKKGGYWGYALCANSLPGKTYKKLVFPDVPDYIQTYYFEGTGSRTLLVWSSNPLEAKDVRITMDGGNHKLWNVETGGFVNLGKTSIHTLYPVYGSSKQNVLFITWDE